MNLTKFENTLEAVEKELEQALVGKPENLYNASMHITFAGGKRLRPLLCILSCKAVGGNAKDAIKTAVAVELIHTFTLIHDDIMDKDELRRGVPSVHKMYNEPIAILAGDLLFAKAFELCDFRVKEILARASSEICEGQYMDLNFENRDYIKENEYLEMVKKKTAVLIEAATNSGAILGGGTDKQIEALSTYGLSIGIAFQIHDDILGITANEEELGKPVGSDIIQGKKSLLVIKALSNLNSSESEELIGILKKKQNSKEEIKRAIDLLRNSNAIEYCTDKKRQLVEDAKTALKNIPDSDANENLVELADFIIQRRI